MSFCRAGSAQAICASFGQGKIRRRTPTSRIGRLAACAVNVQLGPAQAFVVEGLEAMRPSRQIEARPGMKVGVQQRRPRRARGPRGPVARRPCRPAPPIVKCGQPTTCSASSGHRRARTPSSLTRQLPGSASVAPRRPIRDEGAGRQAFEVLLRRAPPVEPHRLSQADKPVP